MSQQIDRTLDILELLVDSPKGLALSAIALTLGLPKSATHRLLTQLAERGYLEQDVVSQHYRPTMRLAVIGFRLLANSGVNDVCQPELDSLAERTGELARIAMVDGDGLTWVAQAQGARYGLRYDGNFGKQVTVSATATGKAWLATLSDEEAIRIVLTAGFGDPAELGPRAVSDVAGLIEALSRTRKQGYGTAYEEGEPGMAAVAAAIPGVKANMSSVGTVSVAGPAARVTRRRLHDIAPDVVEVARRLSELWPVRQLQPSARLYLPNDDERASA
ncbi:MAG: IclR family transcriptional regulator [Alphaproteobacteria bacterium]|nr:IclR family transcriptional regulator [Alphaproteobacteria bacterium]